MPGNFAIDLSEEFIKLPKAPITEAVMDIRVAAQSGWEEMSLRSSLEEILPDYRHNDTHHTAQHTLEPRPGQPPEVQLRGYRLKGLRFRSKEKPQIAAFNCDGLVFSRLRPYETWQQFHDEAIRLWTIFTQLAPAAEIERIGLRYINRIPLSGENVKLEDFIDPHPDTPRGLDMPYSAYFERETFRVPGHQYNLTIIRAIQPPQHPEAETGAIILDFDAFMEAREIAGIPTDDLNKHFAHLRWLKNKAFFGSITDRLLRQMKEGTT